MEIHEVSPAVSPGGIFGALIWLLVVVPLAWFFFGAYGLLGAVLLAFVMRAMKPRKFKSVDS